jgi:hypothetical protein
MADFINSILESLSQLGHLGIALGLMIEIIPSEIVLGYGGYMISQGHLNFFLGSHCRDRRRNACPVIFILGRLLWRQTFFRKIREICPY